MTIRSFRALVRHFVGAIVEPPLLSDIGVDALRRVLISLLSFFLCLGFFLPRVFISKYRALSAQPTAGPYLLAWPGDALFMIALPMYIVGFAAVIVSPMLFPDETDYRVLTPLPIRRVHLFAAKLAALLVVTAAAVLGVNAVISVTLPAVTGGRWAPHGILARVAAHWLTACVASAWTVSAVMALQGLSLVVIPERWRHRVATTLQAAVFLVLLVSVPFFVQLTGRSVTAATVVAAPQSLLPPIWFLGVERWLLGGSAAVGYAKVAMFAGIASVVSIVTVTATFIALFRSAEALAGGGAAPTPSAVRVRVGRWLRTRAIVRGPEAAVIGFALRGLTRSRLHQFTFAVVGGCGLAMLAAQISTLIDGRSLVAQRPQDAMTSAIAAPLMITLCAAIGFRAVFLLPLDRGAGWVFKLIDDPRTRASALTGVVSVFVAGSILPAIAVAMLVQPRLLGWSTLASTTLTTLLGLVLVEVVVARWRRIPYACSYLPGKRHITYTVAILLGAYAVFVGVGAPLVRWSIVHPSHLLLIGGLLLAAFAGLRRARLRAFGEFPLEFEDEDPAAVIVMPLGGSA